MNLLFAPMFIQGMGGFHRRWYDGGKYFEQTSGVSNFWTELNSSVFGLFGMEVPNNLLGLNVLMSVGAFILALGQVPFILNFFLSIKGGRKTNSDNPWHCTTLEWATPTPPPHGNFDFEPVVVRGPYEYSVPGIDQDYFPQWEIEPGKAAPVPAGTKASAPAHHGRPPRTEPIASLHSWTSLTPFPPVPTRACTTPRSASGSSSPLK
jgi:cytochrome c oxidase subunit 1